MSMVMMSCPSGNGTKIVFPNDTIPIFSLADLIFPIHFQIQPLRTVANAIKSLTMSVLHCDSQLELARLLIQRLERLSADSTWAHRASGYRGALIKYVESLEFTPQEPLVIQEMDELIRSAFNVLIAAARQIPEVGIDALPNQITGDLTTRM
jgi:hypothetical protein